MSNEAYFLSLPQLDHAMTDECIVADLNQIFQEYDLDSVGFLPGVGSTVDTLNTAESIMDPELSVSVSSTPVRAPHYAAAAVSATYSSTTSRKRKKSKSEHTTNPIQDSSLPDEESAVTTSINEGAHSVSDVSTDTLQARNQSQSNHVGDSSNSLIQQRGRGRGGKRKVNNQSKNAASTQPQQLSIECCMPKSFDGDSVKEFCEARGEARGVSKSIQPLLNKIAEYLRPKPQSSTRVALCGQCRHKLSHVIDYRRGDCCILDEQIKTLLLDDISTASAFSHMNMVIKWLRLKSLKIPNAPNHPSAAAFPAAIEHLESVMNLPEFQNLPELKAKGEQKVPPSRRGEPDEKVICKESDRSSTSHTFDMVDQTVNHDDEIEAPDRERQISNREKSSAVPLRVSSLQSHVRSHTDDLVDSRNRQSEDASDLANQYQQVVDLTKHSDRESEIEQLKRQLHEASVAASQVDSLRAQLFSNSHALSVSLQEVQGLSARFAQVEDSHTAAIQAAENHNERLAQSLKFEKEEHFKNANSIQKLHDTIATMERHFKEEAMKIEARHQAEINHLKRLLGSTTKGSNDSSSDERLSLSQIKHAISPMSNGVMLGSGGVALAGFVLGVSATAIAPVAALGAAVGAVGGLFFSWFRRPSDQDKINSLCESHGLREYKLSSASSDKEVSTAMRVMSLIHHPDKGGDLREFQARSAAFTELGRLREKVSSNPTTRLFVQICEYAKSLRRSKKTPGSFHDPSGASHSQKLDSELRGLYQMD